MKKIVAGLPVLALVATLLTGCSSAPDIKISGKFGETVTIKSGIPASGGSNLLVVEHGSKPETEASFVVSHRTVFNATTGETLVSQNQVLPVKTEDSDPEWMREVVSTTGVGERSVLLSDIVTVFGEGVAAQAGMKDTDPIILVDDIVLATQATASGAEKTLPAGFPTLKIGEDGVPVITLPAGGPPSELMIANTIEGDGEVVKEGSDVVVNYQGTNWRTGEVFDQSYGSRFPISFNTEGVVSGFKKALVGQKVGSQVVAIIPPAEGYGEAGSASAQIQGTDVLVFVIDILGTLPAAK